jgi:hypothetical protein
MINLILRDSTLHPNAFIWRGPLSAPSIAEWERTQSLHAPEDLKRLWTLRGGADLFDDSETVLQPFGAEEYDLIGPVSSVFWGKELSTDFCVFHTGLVNSVFRKSSGSIYVLTSPDDLSQMSLFQDLDEWYASTIRPTYAEGYSLDAPA